MKTPLRFLLVAGLALLAGVGCQTKTYPPMKAEADYTVQDLGHDCFLIYYEGDESKSEERIVDFALLRACHLAQEKDYDYFAVLNRGRTGSDGSVFTSADFYEDLKSGLVIKGYTSRPDRLFVFKPSDLERMIRGKYVDGQGEARLKGGETTMALNGPGYCLPVAANSN